MYVRFKKFRIAKSSTKKLICDSAIREKFFTNLIFDSIDAAMDKFEEAMVLYAENEEIVQSVTGFNWIVTHV